MYIGKSGTDNRSSTSPEEARGQQDSIRRTWATPLISIETMAVGRSTIRGLAQLEPFMLHTAHQCFLKSPATKQSVIAEVCDFELTFRELISFLPASVVAEFNEHMTEVADNRRHHAFSLSTSASDGSGSVLGDTGLTGLHQAGIQHTNDRPRGPPG